MPRPGGNPELAKYRFKNKGDEPLSKKMSTNFTEKMHSEIRKNGGSEFIREAVAKALEQVSDLQST